MLTTTRIWFPIIDEEHTRRELIDGIVAGRFEFNGEEHELGQRFDWRANPSTDVEWLIMLHKFYYATGLGIAWRETGDARYVNRWMELTASWMESVPAGFLSSDVAGRRIQNWISAWHYFEHAPQITEAFRRQFFGSLEQQLSWLADHLTLARNHRTLELLTLFLGGIALPELPQASQWLDVAAAEIVRNLATDLRADGVHCEQSTDYHHIVLRNALAIRRLAHFNEIPMPAEFDRLLRRALEFALWIHRPDGLIPSLSDGDTASFLGLLDDGYDLYGDARYLWVGSRGRQGRAPRETQAAFPHGGYYIWRSGWGETEAFEDERFLVFDCGPLGDGNHGHLDLLSFELYGYGQPLIVDPGRYTYAPDGETGWRALFRGSSYHNTVTVDGLDQARGEWHKNRHRIRRPHAAFEMLHCEPGVFRGRAVSHEYDAVHEREIRATNSRHLVITDELTSPTQHRYDLWFHFAPSAEGALEQSGAVTRVPHLRIEQRTEAAASVEHGWVSPTYGVKLRAPVLRYSATGTNVRFETHLEVHA